VPTQGFKKARALARIEKRVQLAMPGATDLSGKKRNAICRDEKNLTQARFGPDRPQLSKRYLSGRFAFSPGLAGLD
jgi:hypothetical protein